MTTNISNKNNESCPAEELLRLLSGKWKPQIFRLAIEGPLRFSSLLRQIEGSNKQSNATALKELEAEGLFIKNIIKLKPLHIEYTLSERGKLMLPVFQQLENLR
ncbi:transcriptional regulator [Elizabethkingia anophelis]|uniref:winged helix-turn-helix transcriptional regulator n=1 Tax=Elizabethkingia anophelis TaxID=1117645 RepID=UPI000995D2E9|nr:helix-turn-helix domain-containing protein [Elizabethkingia anophelis]AQW95255.1 transcriptional regulator [Elizabethkingia anophelis]MDV3855001.1 transcriptional regulator [Elizabethkingia anophelis]MDV3859965.1 transcriptional regulator [Elizabethkingia anophelis]MDV3908126.1 transcriptional regulator [Elizabethkingia anophelis]MDV3923593.1 transcriptional regulator [Elizabethkingia anophelis]